MAKRPTYRVLRDFDFVPKPNVVLVLKEGETRRNLTRDCIAKGIAIDALEPVNKED